MTTVEQVDELLRDIWKNLDNPETLSIIILKLAVLYGGVGNLLADAQDEERRLKAHYELQLNQRKLEIIGTQRDDRGKAVSATYAESVALIELQEIQNSYLTAQHNVTVLKLKRGDTESAIDAARSRLSLIKESLRQSN